MGHWPKVVILLFALPLASASILRQNSTRSQSLRAQHTLSTHIPNLLVLLGQSSGPSCQCTFDDVCTCEGALKFMDCVKKACNSGECQCMEKDGTNHFLESCSAMGDECAGIGLKCTPEQATCKGADLDLHSKVKGHAVDKKAIENAADEETAPAQAQVKDPKKYVLHSKYKATVKNMHSHSHRVFAQGIIVTVVVLCVTIAMASSANALVSSCTWGIIDFVIATFLAVAWFIVVIHSLDFFQLVGLWKVAIHMAVSVVFLFASVLISWSMRNNDTTLSTFQGIFTPMVMWCNAGFVETVQKYFKDSELYIFLFLIVLAVWYGALALFFHYLISKATKKGWGDDTSDVMAGGSLAAGFVLWCHMMVTGTFHSIEGPHTNPPTLTQVALLNGLSVFFIALSLFMLPVLSRKSKQYKDANVGSNNYWKLRMCGTGTHFVSVLPRFSFILSLGHLILSHSGYTQGSIGAQLTLALVSTGVGMLMIFLCAYVPFLKRDTEIAAQLRGLLVGLGGLMVGVAWSGLLDNSINMMIKGSGYAHPFPVKLGITAFLTAFILPVYFWYLKPTIMSKGAPNFA